MSPGCREVIYIAASVLLDKYLMRFITPLICVCSRAHLLQLCTVAPYKTPFLSPLVQSLNDAKQNYSHLTKKKKNLLS